MRIVLTGGGTGGHSIPLEPIVATLRTRFTEIRDQLPSKVAPEEFGIYFVGVADKHTRELFQTLDVPVIHVPAAKLRRYISHLTVFDFIFRLPLGLVWALWQLLRLMPDVVMSKGGYGSIPIVIAAWVYRIPILLHESDVTPGLANRLVMRFATTAAVSWPQTRGFYPKYQSKMFVTGVPIRTTIGQFDLTSARQQLTIPLAETVLLVLGGSQGAKQLNELLLLILPSLIIDATVIHVTGKDHYEAVSTVAREVLANSSRREAYRAYDFLTDQLDVAIAAADVVISRAGATTLAELSRAKKACLLVPLAGAANDHQRQNAAILEQAEAARVLEPANLGRNLFERSVRELLTDKRLRTQLAQNIAQFDHPQAARDISELTLKLATGLVPTYDDATIVAT